MATAPKLTTDKAPRNLDVKKGDRVRLLQPFWDNVQRFEADEVIVWPFDYPPDINQACLPDEVPAASTAPAMGDGRPPAGYLDPRTGQPYTPPQGV